MNAEAEGIGRDSRPRLGIERGSILSDMAVGERILESGRCRLGDKAGYTRPVWMEGRRRSGELDLEPSSSFELLPTITFARPAAHLAWTAQTPTWTALPRQ